MHVKLPAQVATAVDLRLVIVTGFSSDIVQLEVKNEMKLL